jgi:hypothetical protein
VDTSSGATARTDSPNARGTNDLRGTQVKADPENNRVRRSLR